MSNQYNLIARLPYFERIPKEIFECDLTPNQKAMLVCLRQLFNEGFLQCSKSIKEMAVTLGVSYRTVHAQLTELIAKGYIAQRHIIHSASDKGSIRFFLTDKLDWIYDYSRKKVVQTLQPSVKVMLRIA